MLKTFKTNGREYPVNFGIRALAATADALGLTMDSLVQNAAMPELSMGRMIEMLTVVTAEAMTDGARRSGTPHRYTDDDVVDLLDEDPELLPVLLTLFRESIGSGNAVFRTAAATNAHVAAASEPTPEPEADAAPQVEPLILKKKR